MTIRVLVSHIRTRYAVPRRASTGLYRSAWRLRAIQPMVHFFRAGPDLVRWELTELERNGACRLAVHHGGGTIIEHFKTAALAVHRVGELEDLLIRARGCGPDSVFFGLAS